MDVCGFWCTIAFIFVYCLPIYLGDSSKQPASGPYRTMLLSVAQCESPYRPYMQDPPMTFTPLLHNTSTAVLVSGNITISRDIKNVKYRMKSSIWENNKWRPNYLMNDIGCHGMLLHLLCTATGVKYDKKNCMFLKGQYNFRNMDVNSLQHLWASKMEYGRLLWRSEVFHQKHGTYICNDYETVTEPA